MTRPAPGEWWCPGRWRGTVDGKALVAGAGLLVVVAVDACGTWVQTGSVLRDRCDHLGVRPYDEADYGVSVQWSTDRPTCRQVYGERP